MIIREGCAVCTLFHMNICFRARASYDKISCPWPKPSAQRGPEPGPGLWPSLEPRPTSGPWWTAASPTTGCGLAGVAPPSRLPSLRPHNAVLLIYGMRSCCYYKDAEAMRCLPMISLLSDLLRRPGQTCLCNGWVIEAWGRNCVASNYLEVCFCKTSSKEYAPCC